MHSAPFCFALIVLTSTSAAIQQDQASSKAFIVSDPSVATATPANPTPSKSSLPVLSAHTVYAPELKIPERAHASFLQGAKNHNAGHYREAAENYSEAIRLYPPYSSAHAYRALALMRLGDFAGAHEAIDRALQLNPLSVDAVRNLGVILATEERLEEAKPHLDRVVAALPHDPKSRLLLALIALQHLDYEAVVRHTNAILPKDGAEYHVLFELRGRALEELGRKEEAVENYRKYLLLGGEDQPTSPAARAAIERLTRKESSALHPRD